MPLEQHGIIRTTILFHLYTLLELPRKTWIPYKDFSRVQKAIKNPMRILHMGRPSHILAETQVAVLPSVVFREKLCDGKINEGSGEGCQEAWVVRWVWGLLKGPYRMGTQNQEIPKNRTTKIVG